MKNFLFPLAALALLFACTPEKTPGGDNNNNGGNSQPTVVELTGIALTEHEITLEKGGNKVLEVKFTPSNASNKSVTWVSSNTSVATVTDGVVVGVAPGSTEIIAKSGNYTDKCQVTVVISAKGISLNKTELAFKALNETETLVATLDPESSTGKIEWGSSDANVASVSPEGVVTSVAPGTAEITASCGSVFAKCAVTVEVAATSLSLDKNSLNLFIGDTETIAATVLPENTTDQLTWLSSDEAIATVQDGVVTAVALGEATITAKAGEKTATCSVKVEFKMNAVDLGLSVKWAECNLGAAKPEDYGDYYAWGETEPYYSSQSPLTWKNGKSAGYDWASYKWCDGSFSTLTKYNTNSSYGTVDNKTILEPEDDVAHVKLGGKWRMPTDAEWTELTTKCTWTWVTNYNGSGINGKLVTATNGNSIFLPAAGCRNEADLFDAGSYGIYWYSSLYTDDPVHAWYMYFYSDSVGRSHNRRCFGHSVRPVSE